MTKKGYINSSVLSIVLCLIFLIDISFVNLILAFIVILVFSNLSNDYKGLFFNNKSFLKLLSTSLIYAILIVAVNYFFLIPLVISLTNSPINYGVFNLIEGNIKFLAISIAVGWFVGGLLEETIFRAYLLKTFESLLPKKVGMVTGVLVSSSIFGYLHAYQGITGQISTGILGAFFAVIYLTNNKNLWLNIYTHGFVNTISMILIYFNIQ